MHLGRIEAWLLALADPTGIRSPLPKGPLRSGELMRLVELADEHGVLPAVAMNLKQLDRREFDEAIGVATERLLRQTAICLSLRSQLNKIAAALVESSLPAVVIKGPDFADRLYPQPGLRPFRDIDLLVPSRALADVEQLMKQLGYAPAAPVAMKHPAGYAQKGWHLARRRGGNDIEIHWNLVNSPALRRRVSVEFDDLRIKEVPSALPKATASSLLLIAAVHGATSHRFDRLQVLCDICQVVRGAAGEIDEKWLAETARRTGSSFAVATALALSEKAMAEPKCGNLLQRFAQAVSVRPSRRVLTPAVVLRSHTALGSARRQLFRELLKRK